MGTALVGVLGTLFGATLGFVFSRVALTLDRRHRRKAHKDALMAEVKICREPRADVRRCISPGSPLPSSNGRLWGRLPESARGWCAFGFTS